MNKFIGKIEDIRVICGRRKNLFLSGYSFIEDANISKSNNVKKSLILSKDNKRYYVPTENIFRNDITEKFGKDKYNYDYSGFSGFIDVECIDNMNTLDIGLWQLSLYIDAAGIESENNIGYEEYLEKDDKNFNMYFLKSQKYLQVNLNNNKVYVECKKEEVNDKDIPINTEHKKNNTLIKVKRFIGNIVFKFLYKFTKSLRIKENRVVFLSDSRVDFYRKL